MNFNTELFPRFFVARNKIYNPSPYTYTRMHAKLFAYPNHIDLNLLTITMRFLSLVTKTLFDQECVEFAIKTEPRRKPKKG